MFACNVVKSGHWKTQDTSFPTSQVQASLEGFLCFLKIIIKKETGARNHNLSSGTCCNLQG